MNFVIHGMFTAWYRKLKGIGVNGRAAQRDWKEKGSDVSISKLPLTHSRVTIKHPLLFSRGPSHCLPRTLFTGLHAQRRVLGLVTRAAYITCSFLLNAVSALSPPGLWIACTRARNASYRWKGEIPCFMNTVMVVG